MTPRVVFPNKLLPYLLVAPQLAITLVFFYWPASQALYQSVLKEDPFGLRSRFVWFDNFKRVLSDPNYLNSVEVTVIFSVATAFVSMVIALLLAVMADRVIRGRGFYRTLMIWPYAVAPAIAGMLWLFLFNPSIGSLAYLLRCDGHRLGPAAQRPAGDGAGRLGRRLEADQLQFPVLRRRPAGDPEIADRGGGDRRRAADEALLDDRLPAARADHLLPARHQHDLRLLRHLRHHPRRHRRRAGQGDRDAGLQGLQRRRVNLLLGDSAAQSVILMVIVIALTAVQFRYVEKKVHYG